MSFLSKILTVGEGRQMKKYNGVVDKINALEPDMQALSDAELRALTAAFRERMDNGESADSLLPEAFAAVREAGVRQLGMRHFDVQLIGGMALNDGQIAEMKTGEGKTLVSTLAGYLNALGGQNVHIVTVNDYLARRDSEWMGQIYRFMGMKVGLIQNGMRPNDRVPAYKADVTYGTNAEFGFDYLRDNMVTRADRRVQRGHWFAVVDEVDSILIDEARTPLIISGAGTKAAETYKKFARIMPMLREEEDFEKDEAKHTIMTTEVGLAKVEEMLGIDDLYDDPTGQLANHLQQALRAQFLFKKDVNYVVINGEVKIVDEFTGRIMEGRRYSEGLHQALEAKEHVVIREENQTLATITLQNYFRLYEKLSGMTGTAMTEDAEFREIYKLPVVAIPPNKPVARVDENDQVYRTINAKFNAVADEVAERHAAGQPMLVGTVSIESSEKLSRLLDKRGIKHNVLNAKHHEREAHIVAQAGRFGAVTIATNMAGRGTDILLGGNPNVLAEDLLRSRGFDPDRNINDPDMVDPDPDDPRDPAPTDEDRAKALADAKAITTEEHEKVLKAGGLCVLGTERHESRRIDNQLRGRSGRQGDPGLTRFYLSLEDDLMRLFGGDKMDRISAMMEKTEMPEDMPIQAGMVSKAIESAQRQVEAMHFGARKNVLEYDDVMNLQRTAIYGERNAILDGKDISDRFETIAHDAVTDVVNENCDPRLAADDWDMEAITKWVVSMTGNEEFDASEIDHQDETENLIDGIVEYFLGVYADKEEKLGKEVMRNLSAQVMLRIIDTRWMAHLQEMDYLKTGIGLRAIGQRDPLVEYKEEAHDAFASMTASMYEDYLRTLLRLQLVKREPAPAPGAPMPGGPRPMPGAPAPVAAPGAPAPAPAVAAPRMMQQMSDEPAPTNVSYNSPEAALNDNSSVAQRTARAAADAKGVPSSVRRPAGGPTPAPVPKTGTIRKDADDPYANVGRNDPCPCGSGLKFKKCHGANR